MALVYQCDMCPASVSEKEAYRSWRKLDVKLLNLKGDHEFTHRADLCPECIADFIKLLQTPNPENQTHDPRP